MYSISPNILDMLSIKFIAYIVTIFITNVDTK